MKNNPYVGPRPYERRHQKNFYGRNRESRDLLSLLLAERVVLFYAQSGAGKTSLLNAKVIPALEDEDFEVLPPARVSSEPPPEVNAAEIENVFIFSVLMSLADENVPATELCTHTLASFLKKYYPENEDDFEAPTPLLLVLDQFEELFTSHRDRWQQAEGLFMQVRDALEAVPELGILFSMREDYVAEVDPYAHIVPRRLRARFRIEPLGPKGALEAITKPALNQGIRFEPGVAERMVDDLRRIKIQRHSGLKDTDEVDVLGPFVEPVQLQVVCRRLWENLPEQEDQAIQQEEVDECGDIDQALTDFYESAVAAVITETEIQERIVRRWFSEQLITPMQTRGLALRGEKDTAGLTNAAVDVLRSNYIIRAEVRAGARWYELAHDRLVDPIITSNLTWEAARQTPLRMAAKQWQESKLPSLLYRDDTLEEALAWLQQNLDEAEPFEQEFLEASQDAERTRRLGKKIRIVATSVGIVVLILIALLAWGAGRNGLEAYSKEWAARSQYWRTLDQEVSMQMAYEAVTRDDAPALLKITAPAFGNVNVDNAEIALRQALLDYYPSELFSLPSGQEATSMLYSPDSRYLYVGLSTGELWIRDRGMKTSVYIAGLGSARALAYNPQSTQIAVGGDDGKTGVVRIWDTQSQQWVHTLRAAMPEGMFDDVYALAYSPDGRYLATGGDYGERFRDPLGTRNDGLIRIWDLETGQVTELTDHTRRVTSVAFSPDGQYLASGSTDKTVRLWRMRQRHTTLYVTPWMTLTGHTEGVRSLAFSPEEPLLATASEDRTIRLWDTKDVGVKNVQAVATLTGHTREVWAVAFDDQGEFLLSGSRDATVRVWHVDVRNPNAVLVLTGHTNVVQGLAFSHDGNTAASGDGAGNIRIWDEVFWRERKLSSLTGHAGRLRQVTYSPDGKFLASGDTRAEAIIWSARTGLPVHRLNVGRGDVWGVTYSPDGRYLVTCSGDRIVRIWDPATGKVLRPLQGHTSDANRAAFSPDGRFLVSAGDDGRAIVWDTTTWDKVEELTGDGAFYDVAYSPDGRFIATGSTDDNVRIWEITYTDDGSISAGEPKILQGHTHDLYSVVFSPDSKILASGGWDTTVRFWSTETFTATAEALEHQEYVYSAMFSPDGQYLATGTRDKSIFLYRLEEFPDKAPALIGIYPAHTDIVWSVAFSPDSIYLASSSWDGTIRRYPVQFEDVWALTEALLSSE